MKAMVAQFHARGVKVFFPYFIWDSNTKGGTRNEGVVRLSFVLLVFFSSLFLLLLLLLVSVQLVWFAVWLFASVTCNN